jgi:hypothetical protein
MDALGCSDYSVRTTPVSNRDMAKANHFITRYHISNRDMAVTIIRQPRDVDAFYFNKKNSDPISYWREHMLENYIHKYY